MSETSQLEADRVEVLIDALPLDAKLAQLTGPWAGAKRTDAAAPLHERLVADGIHFEEFAAAGLGQLTRHYGTTPLEPEAAHRPVASVTRPVRELVASGERVRTGFVGAPLIRYSPG